MPLLPGHNNIGHNIKELMSTGRPRNQAVAIALDHARKHHANGGLAAYANGGYTAPKNPNVVRENFHIGGLFHGSTFGRGDKIKTKVPNGSHIIPADVVSILGQGNTLAGSKVLEHLFPIPHQKPSLSSSLIPGFASGGSVPVYVSDGEFSVHPLAVQRIGGGDQEHGHEILDHFIVKTRKIGIERMKKLPGPKKD